MQMCVRVKPVEASLAEKDREDVVTKVLGAPMQGWSLLHHQLRRLKSSPLAAFGVEGSALPCTCCLHWCDQTFVYSFLNSSKAVLFSVFDRPSKRPRLGKYQWPLGLSPIHYPKDTKACTCSSIHVPTTMSLQRPLRGHCACRRNQYYIRAPQGVSEVAQVIFSTGESHSTLTM